MTPNHSPISQDEINSILWKACDTFRGTVDPSEYKNYILVMLFLKYVSDVWLDHYDGYKQRFGDDENAIRRRMDREKFRLPKGADYYSLYEQRNETNIGEIIDMALASIEEANVEKLQGVFRNISFNSEAALGQTRQRNERLKNLLTDFHDPRLDMRPSRINGLDVIGNAYEYLIGKFAATAGKKAGEFYTPPEVSRLLAKLLSPQPGERIYDPACGSGSLLIKCAEEVGSQDYAIYGQENNGSTWALAMMNMRESLAGRLPEDLLAEMATRIEVIIESLKIRDWENNADVMNDMRNAIEDYLYDDIEKAKDIRFSDVELDEIIEQVIDIARKRA